MSILLHSEIQHYHDKAVIVIDPFVKLHLGPNSYDVCLGDTIKVYDIEPGAVLDPKIKNKTNTLLVPPTGLTLFPNVLYLGHTVEIIGSDHFVPMYEGRSSMARLGIGSHISAGFGDVGFIGQLTLEITVVHPVVVYPGMRIGQVYFHQINAIENFPKNRYYGKYTTQTNGPQESLAYLDT